MDRAHARASWRMGKAPKIFEKAKDVGLASLSWKSLVRSNRCVDHPWPTPFRENVWPSEQCQNPKGLGKKPRPARPPPRDWKKKTSSAETHAARHWKHP